MPVTKMETILDGDASPARPTIMARIMDHKRMYKVLTPSIQNVTIYEDELLKIIIVMKLNEA